MGFFPFVPPPVTGATITPPVNLSGTGAAELFGANTTGDTNERVQLGADGAIRWGTGGAAVDASLSRQAAGVMQFPSGGLKVSGALDVVTVGAGLRVAEGGNAKQGTFALGGTATTVVANTSVTATSRIFLQTLTLGTVAVASTLAVSAISAGVSFTVTPSVAADTSTIAYEIFEAG